MIDTAPLLTRGTIWLAIVAYAIGIGLFGFAQRRRTWLAVVRVVWTIGCLALIAHIICAFQFYHHWSQESAYRDTALQTAAVVGYNWGGGLFINYAVLIGWIVDISCWWLSGINSYLHRRWFLVLAWHAFLIFIIFNATVVFNRGIVRWFGLVISLYLIVMWILVAKRSE